MIINTMCIIVMTNRAFDFKNAFDSAGAGKCLCDGYDKIGKLNKLNKDLAHIVIQGNNLAL